eukprot:6472613-Amphidinium_carterae.2
MCRSVCHCVLLRPVANEADFELLDKEGYSSSVVRQEFKDQAAAVTRDILAKAGVKRFESCELNGAAFAALAQQLCATVGADGVPEVTSAWQQVCVMQLQKGLDAGEASFKEAMAREISAKQPTLTALSRTGLQPPTVQIPLHEDALQSCIELADASARKAFFAFACAPGEDEAKQLSSSLDAWRRQACEGNEKVAVAFCEALLGILYTPVQTGIREGIYTCKGGFNKYSTDLETAMLDYRDCSSSCVPEHVAARCAEAFARRIEDERHLVMDSDRALSEAQRRAALDAEKLQYEQLARKRQVEEQQAEMKRQRVEHSSQLETLQSSAKLMQEQMAQQREEDKRVNEQRQAQMEQYMRQNQQEGQEMMKQMMAFSAKQSEAQSQQMDRVLQGMSDAQAAQQESLAALTQSMAELASREPQTVRIERGGGCVLQ